MQVATVLEYRAAHRDMDSAWIAYAGDHPLEGMTRKKFRAIVASGQPTDVASRIRFTGLNEHPEIHDTPELERILFIPDTHIPFQNEDAWQLMLRAARRFKPHRIVVLGDLFDFYAVSSHSKNPKRKASLAEEVEIGKLKLDELDALGATTKQMAAGNHEFRLDRYLADNAPALAELSGLTVRSLFDLDSRGWEFYPYQTHFAIGKYLSITHDCGSAGPSAHTKARATFEGSVMIGHTHRASLDYKGNAQGEAHAGIMCGWLGDVEQIDYLHRVTANQWINGFAIGWLEPDSTFHVNICPIVKGKVMVAGELIR